MKINARARRRQVSTYPFQVPVDEAFGMQVNETLAYVHQLEGVSKMPHGKHGLLARLNRLKVGLFLTNARMSPFFIHGDTRQGRLYSKPVSVILAQTPYRGNRFLCFNCFQIMASLDSCWTEVSLIPRSRVRINIRTFFNFLGSAVPVIAITLTATFSQPQVPHHTSPNPP